MGARSVSRTPAHTGVRRGSTPRCVGRGRLLPRNVRRLWALTRTHVCTLTHTPHAMQPPARPLALRIATAAVAPRRGATLELSSASRGPARRPCAGVVPSCRRLCARWVSGLVARRDRGLQQAAQAAPRQRRASSGGPAVAYGHDWARCAAWDALVTPLWPPVCVEPSCLGLGASRKMLGSVRGDFSRVCAALRLLLGAMS